MQKDILEASRASKLNLNGLSAIIPTLGDVAHDMILLDHTGKNSVSPSMQANLKTKLHFTPEKTRWHQAH